MTSIEVGDRLRKVVGILSITLIVYVAISVITQSDIVSLVVVLALALYGIKQVSKLTMVNVETSGSSG